MSGPFRTAVVLSGGGAYAAYEVGVMKALFSGRAPSTDYQPLDPDLFVGSSAGAMNAAAVVARDSAGLPAAIAELERIWMDRIAEDTSERCGNGVYRIRGMPFEYFDVNCWRSKGLGILVDTIEDGAVFVGSGLGVALDVASSTDSVTQSLLRGINLSGLVSTRPFHESLQSIIPLEGVRRSRRALRIVATSLTTGQLKVFTEADVDRLGYGPFLASTALPAFFTPQELDGGLFIDGSTLANTPLLPAIAEAETMHVIYMDPDVANIHVDRLQNTIDVIDRTLVVHFSYALNRDIRLARRINHALEMIEQGIVPESAADLHTLLSVASRWYRRVRAGRPYRRLTIHRYHPREDLGEALGLMNINVERLAALIERGYEDALTHDCEASGCVERKTGISRSGASRVRPPDPPTPPPHDPTAPPIRTPTPPRDVRRPVDEPRADPRQTGREDDGGNDEPPREERPTKPSRPEPPAKPPRPSKPESTPKPPLSSRPVRPPHDVRPERPARPARQDARDLPAPGRKVASETVTPARRSVSSSPPKSAREQERSGRGAKKEARKD